MTEPSISGYELGEAIGRDGLGTLYEARRVASGRRASVKIFGHGALDRQRSALLLNEAIAASAIRQSNIAEVIDLGELADGRPYVATELLEGESLATRLRRVRRLPLADALDFVQQAAGALAAAHDEGLVHGALEAEALFLVTDLSLPRGERVKVHGFGARRLRGTEGSPYLAPEQRGSPAEEPGPAADVYALGALLYHAVCGEAPLATGDQAPVLPRALDRHVPRQLEEVILRALAPAPAERFDSMAAFVDALAVETPARPRGGFSPARLAYLAVGFTLAVVLVWSSRAPARSVLYARGRALARTLALRLPSRAAPAFRAPTAPRRPVITPLTDDEAKGLRPAEPRKPREHGGRTPARTPLSAR
jgi:serine/threonine protein kinase